MDSARQMSPECQDVYAKPQVHRAFSPPQPVRLNINAEVPTPFVLPWSWYVKQRFHWQLPKLLSVTVIADGVVDESRYAALVHEDQQFGLRASFNQTAALEKYIGYHLVSLHKVSQAEVQYTLSRLACPCSSSDAQMCGTSAPSNTEDAALASYCHTTASANAVLVAAAAPLQRLQVQYTTTHGGTNATAHLFHLSSDRASAAAGLQAMPLAQSQQTTLSKVLKQRLIDGRPANIDRRAPSAVCCPAQTASRGSHSVTYADEGVRVMSETVTDKAAQEQRGGSGSTTTSAILTSPDIACIPLGSAGAAAIAAAAGPLRALAVRRPADRGSSGCGSGDKDEAVDGVRDAPEDAHEPARNNPFRKSCCSCPCHVWRQYWPDPSNPDKREVKQGLVEGNRHRCRGGRGTSGRTSERITDADWCQAGAGRGRKRSMAVEVGNQDQPPRRPRLGSGPPLPPPTRPALAAVAGGTAPGRTTPRQHVRASGPESLPWVHTCCADAPQCASVGAAVARQPDRLQLRRGAVALQPEVTTPPLAAAEPTARVEVPRTQSEEPGNRRGNGHLGSSNAACWTRMEHAGAAVEHWEDPALPQPLSQALLPTFKRTTRVRTEQQVQGIPQAQATRQLQQQPVLKAQPYQVRDHQLPDDSQRHPTWCAPEHQEPLQEPARKQQQLRKQQRRGRSRVATEQQWQGEARVNVVPTVISSPDSDGHDDSTRSPGNSRPNDVGREYDHVSGEEAEGRCGELRKSSLPQEEESEREEVEEEEEQQPLRRRGPIRVAVGVGTSSLSPDTAPAERQPLQLSPHQHIKQRLQLAVTVCITAAAAARMRRTAVDTAIVSQHPSKGNMASLRHQFFALPLQRLPQLPSKKPTQTTQTVQQQSLELQPHAVHVQVQQHPSLALHFPSFIEAIRTRCQSAYVRSSGAVAAVPCGNGTRAHTELPPRADTMMQAANECVISSPYKPAQAVDGPSCVVGTAVTGPAGADQGASDTVLDSDRPALRQVNRQPAVKHQQKHLKEASVVSRSLNFLLRSSNHILHLAQAKSTQPPSNQQPTHHEVQQQQQQQHWQQVPGTGQEQETAAVEKANGSQSPPTRTTQPQLVELDLTLPGRLFCRPGWDVRLLTTRCNRPQPGTVIRGPRLQVDRGVLPDPFGAGCAGRFLRLFVERDGFVDGHTSAKCICLEEADDGSTVLTRLPSHALNCTFLGWGLMPGDSLVLRVCSIDPLVHSGSGAGGTRGAVALPLPSAIATAAVTAGAVARALDRRRQTNGFRSPAALEVRGRVEVASSMGKRVRKVMRVTDLLSKTPVLAEQI